MLSSERFGSTVVDVKTVPLSEASSRLDEFFDEAQAGSPVVLVRGGQVVKLERVEPPEFGGDLRTLENMLLDAVRGPHADWTQQDLEDIAQRVRQKRTNEPADSALGLVRSGFCHKLPSDQRLRPLPL